MDHRDRTGRRAAATGGRRPTGTSIRYVDTLGRLATGDGDVVFHNTLAASDYGLIDEDGLVPRPDYWAAVLWARLIGPRSSPSTTRATWTTSATYAHCTRADGGGGTTYVVINASADHPHRRRPGDAAATMYQLTAESLD